MFFRTPNLPFILEYGIHIIQGYFGGGKTFSVFDTILHAKTNGENIILISNVPYSFVDIFLDTADKVHSFIDVLNQYIASTNQDIQRYDNETKRKRKLPKIVVVLDELHTIFNSRNFDKGQMEELMTPLTQCRKRNISFIGITQKPATVDRVFRLLTDYTIVMKRSILWFGFTIRDGTRANVYHNVGDIVDINPELSQDNMSTEGRLESLSYITRYIFRPLSDFFSLLVRFRRSYHLLENEKKITNYVVGYPNPLSVLPTYEQFVDMVFAGSWSPPPLVLTHNKKGRSSYQRNRRDLPHPSRPPFDEVLSDEVKLPSLSLPTTSDVTSSQTIKPNYKYIPSDTPVPSYQRRR